MTKELLFSLLLFNAEPDPALADNTYSIQDVACLAQNIYFEARDQNIIGQIAVAHVTINRVKDTRFPNNICSVVKQGYIKGRRDCQFSWYCDGKSDIMYEKQEKQIAFDIAKHTLKGRFVDVTQGATHYHSRQVNPWWAKALTKVGIIEDHIFYRWESTKVAK